MERPEQAKEPIMLTEAQTGMLTLLDQVAKLIVSGEVKAMIVTMVNKDNLGRNAYIVTPNTTVTLLGSMEIAKHEMAEGVLQEARQQLGVPAVPRGGQTDQATADALLPQGVIAKDGGDMPEHQSLRPPRR